MVNPEVELPAWERQGSFRDISYEVAEHIAKITICRPEVRNAFRPQTLTSCATPSTRPATTPTSA